MNILGLHFGHDAGVSVVKSGRTAAYVFRERHCRTKHAISLEFKNIRMAVEAAGLRWDQIDFSITSTQHVELIIDNPANFSIRFDRCPGHQAPCTMTGLVETENIDPARLLVESLMQIFYDPQLAGSFLYHHYGHAFPEYRTRQPADFTRFPWIDEHASALLWTGMTLGQIAGADFPRCSATTNCDTAFISP